MTVVETFDVHEAAVLARSGVFPMTDDQVAVTPSGAAIYVYDRTVIVRPQGPRPAGVQPVPRRRPEFAGAVPLSKKSKQAE